MQRFRDILKSSRLLIIFLAAVLFLSGCVNNSFTPEASLSDAQNADPPSIDCWQADVLSQVYDIIGSTIMKMYDTLSAGSLSVMMIGFAVWVALRLLKFVSSVTEDSPGEIWNEILRKAFICLLCGYLAYSSGTLLYVINFLLFPIYAAFLEFGSKILELATQNVTSVTVLGQKVDFLQQKISCGIVGDISADLNGFPDSIENSMKCMVCALVERLHLGGDIALTAMRGDGVLAILSGLLVFLIFYVVGFGFVFYLIDSLFRFGMMILLLPIFIMSYAFGPTRKWTGIGFSNIMNSAAFLMAFSIIVATVLIAMVNLINDNTAIFNPDNPEAHFQDFSITVLCLLLIGFLVFGSMSVSQQMTSAIIGGKVDAKFQQNLKAVAQAILGAITGGFAWVGKKVAFNQKTKLGRMLNTGSAFRETLNRWAGRG